MPPEEHKMVKQDITYELISPINLFVPSSSSSDISASYESDSDTTINLNYLPTDYNREVVVEETFQETLKRATGRNDLSEVTKVTMQVVTIDISLQQLSFYTPLLNELTLDGSILFSFRDLGCGLKNLKILSVARCGLTTLDGMFGLESLEQFYAQNNDIENLSPCAFLPYIKVINLASNRIKSIGLVSYLSICPYLQHLVLAGNVEITNLSGYRTIIKGYLPNLVALDHVEFLLECNDQSNTLNVDEPIPSCSAETNNCPELSKQRLAIRNRSSKHGNVVTNKIQYVCQFPPKVLTPRSSSSSVSSDLSTSINYKNEVTTDNLQHSSSESDLDSYMT